MKARAEVGAGYARVAGRTARGFSLVELMVTVAIVGIIAAIAYPNYRRFVLQSNRTDAVRALTLNAQILQRCYSQYFSFNNVNCPAVLDAVSANGYYAIDNTNVTPTTYSLVATAVGAQLADTTCRKFTLDQTGKQSAVDSGNADQSTICWGSN